MHRLVILCVCIVVANMAHAQALRCGLKLISPGDRKVEVLHRCGEPDSIDERVIYKVIYAYDKFNPALREVSVPIVVEEWLYNLGPHRLKRLLYFENGILLDIQALDYGY
jgi:hypothetical protein